MACNATTILVPDDIGGAWQLGIIPGGEIQTTKVAGNTPPTVSLVPFAGAPVMFNLTVLSATGQLDTNGVPAAGNPTTRLLFQVTDCTQWSITVDANGILHTTLVPKAGASCPQLINDTAGQSWSLSATVDGRVIINFNSAVAVAPFLLEDYESPSTVYELKYVVGSGLGLFLSSGTNVPLQVALDTPSPQLQFFLQVVGGQLSLLAANIGARFTVGALVTGDGPYPVPVQPGGPGTPVTMPSQTQGEMLGLWVAGCGHWFNNWDIHSAQVCGVTSALVCCPLCLYLQRIITPYSLIHTDANYIIFA